MWQNNRSIQSVLRTCVRGALKLVGICLVLFCFSLASAQENPSTTPLSTATLPTAQAIKSCLDQAGGAECLDNLFRDALKEHSTQEVLQLIQRFESEDPELRRDCHPVVHAIGRETYRIKGNIHDSFSACDQTCHSGCYHGSVERFLRGDAVYTQVDRHPSAAELKQKAALACDPNIPVRLRFPMPARPRSRADVFLALSTGGVLGCLRRPAGGVESELLLRRRIHGKHLERHAGEP